MEPTDGLRAAAKVAHPELENRLASAALPELGMPFDGKFDGILCSAVLMHVPDHQLFDAALAIRALLNPHGRLLLSLPLTRGDNLVEQRDTSGRLFQGYTAEEIQLLFERLGFQCIGRWDSDDALARAGTSWYTLLLELRTTGSMLERFSATVPSPDASAKDPVEGAEKMTQRNDKNPTVTGT